MLRLLRALAALAAVVTVTFGQADAQPWPARPVTIIVPFTAGTTADIMARGFAQYLSDTLGQSFVVDNRGGAAGNIGAAAVAHAPADGYTLLLATTGQAATNKLMYQNMQFDPERDFAPIALIGKNIDIAFDSMAAYVSTIQSGQIKALAMAGAQRWPKLANVATVSESGLPGFEATVWYALLAPAGAPDDVVAKLNAAANSYLKSDKATSLFDDLGLQPAGGTPQDLKAFIASEVQKWAPIIKAADIKF